MASTIRSHRADAGLWKMLAVGILALPRLHWDTYSAAGARAALEHQRNVEVALESRAVCEKCGMTRASPTSTQFAGIMRSGSWKASGSWGPRNCPTGCRAADARNVTIEISQRSTA